MALDEVIRMNRKDKSKPTSALPHPPYQSISDGGEKSRGLIVGGAVYSKGLTSGELGTNFGVVYVYTVYSGSVDSETLESSQRGVIFRHKVRWGLYDTFQSLARLWAAAPRIPHDNTTYTLLQPHPSPPYYRARAKCSPRSIAPFARSPNSSAPNPDFGFSIFDLDSLSHGLRPSDSNRSGTRN